MSRQPADPFVLVRVEQNLDQWANRTLASQYSQGLCRLTPKNGLQFTILHDFDQNGNSASLLESAQKPARLDTRLGARSGIAE